MRIIVTALAAMLLWACSTSHSNPVPQAVEAINHATQKIQASAEPRQAVVAVIDLEDALQAIPGMQEHRPSPAEAQQLRQATQRLQAAIMPKIAKFPASKQKSIKLAIANLTATPGQKQ